jgi:hypothetical protein
MSTIELLRSHKKIRLFHLKRIAAFLIHLLAISENLLGSCSTETGSQ